MTPDNVVREMYRDAVQQRKNPSQCSLRLHPKAFYELRSDPSLADHLTFTDPRSSPPASRPEVRLMGMRLEPDVSVPEDVMEIVDFSGRLVVAGRFT